MRWDLGRGLSESASRACRKQEENCRNVDCAMFDYRARRRYRVGRAADRDWQPSSSTVRKGCGKTETALPGEDFNRFDTDLNARALFSLNPDELFDQRDANPLR